MTILKTLSPRELVLRTNNLLARMSKSNHSNKIEQLEFDGLVLKNLSKTLTINNIEIPMRIKEFELLWYLASREGEVISKSELLEKYGDMTITKMLTLSMSTYIEFARN